MAPARPFSGRGCQAYPTCALLSRGRATARAPGKTTQPRRAGLQAGETSSMARPVNHLRIGSVLSGELAQGQFRQQVLGRQWRRDVIDRVAVPAFLLGDVKRLVGGGDQPVRE